MVTVWPSVTVAPALVVIDGGSLTPSTWMVPEPDVAVSPA